MKIRLKFFEKSKNGIFLTHSIFLASEILTDCVPSNILNVIMKKQESIYESRDLKLA